MTTAIAWCLAWGKDKTPQFDLPVLQQMHQALEESSNLPEQLPQELKQLISQVQQLQGLEFPHTVQQLKGLTEKYPQLWNSEIGLVYGGATKIKQYVFEGSKLPDIRGASALLDRINLVDLPAFFGQGKKSITISQWLANNFAGLEAALIPELIIYSTGGNILAFCPGAFVDDLANAIEKRYTEETLTANSCAVGGKFKPLEIRFGLLPNQIEKTFWLEKYQQNLNHELVKAYFDQPESNPQQAFEYRKSFNELAGKLASLFNQRRSGNDFPHRPSRRYPPMFETHPCIIRDDNDRGSAVIRADELPNNPWFSESLARKRLVGQIAKRDDTSKHWYEKAGFDWQDGQIYIPSWVQKFEEFLRENNQLSDQYYRHHESINTIEEARSLIEIGNASKPDGFVAYIYADGNNMGGYIQKIKTPEEYRQFSKDIFKATTESVYKALAEHLHPHKLENIKEDKLKRNGQWIHPFEILTIGGDDVMLIVPADKALAIAKTIGEEFENILFKKGYKTKPATIHRYRLAPATPHQCELSMSAGVLITADDTPIYYAEKLTEQLLKSAKKLAKDLKKQKQYGGTIDFLVMKSVTMISSEISEFRSQGLTKKKQNLKLYAAPYTLHEIGGLLATATALKAVKFPRSQIYQIRSLLEQGKQTAILNYRYFRVRLSKQDQETLKKEFENPWCQPKDPSNTGNLAPWISSKHEKEPVTYETIWRELVDLYPFIPEPEDNDTSKKPNDIFQQHKQK